MKSMTKLMVVAMLLVAALVVAPVAARTYVGEHADGIGIYNISNGDTIYVGEQHLEFNESSFEGGGSLSGGQLVHFTDTKANTIDVSIPIPNAKDFELKSSDVGTVTGTYCVFNASMPAEYDNRAGTVTVWNPKVELDVVLNDSPINSVNTKSIARTTKLAFKLTTNLAGFSGLNFNDQPKLKIEVSLPSGGKTTEFGGKSMDYNMLRANGTTVYVYSVDLTGYEAGTYTAQAKWYDKGPGASFYGKGFDSNTVTFDVTTKALSLTASKDSVVRGKSFSVTITGDSKAPYILLVKEVGGLTADEKYPLIAPGQPGVFNATKSDYDDLKFGDDNTTEDFSKYAPGLNYTQAWIETDAGGTRTVQFNTTPDTDDRQFTIRVQDPNDKNKKYDEVKVRVEKGAVTITASGTGTYYIGEEITLEGTCTEGDKVYLFITGPNLPSNGADPLKPSEKVIDDNRNLHFLEVDVETDDTWSEKWNTAEIDGTLDAGGYTIYAVSAPVDKSGLSDAEYDTISIQLRSGFISATSSGAVVAKGDDLKLTGVAQGDPSEVYIWIFGKNYYGEPGKLKVRSETVEDDGTFEFELKGADTKDLAAGQYFVVIQHPMMNGEQDIKANEATGTIYGSLDSGFTSVKITGLQASDAANALIKALDSPNIDDTYVKLTFIIEEPQIFINPIGDVPAGSTFTISGTTNLAVGDTLNVEVTSAAFTPTEKGEAAGFASVARTTEVKAGDGANTWSVEIDGSAFKPDQYIVKVECIETDTTATANFNVVEAVPTTQPPVSPTATVTTTTTETTTTEATPTESPGFGALLALAGLGAVAYLVLRRD